MRTDWLQTFTGKKFFPLEPKIEDICIEDIAHSLSMQCRFVGHSKRYYSVAQHSVVMVNRYFSRPFDLELSRYALLHDASEAYLSDIPRPLKHLPQFQFYRDAENYLSGLIYQKFGLDRVEPTAVKQADWDILCEEAMSPVIMFPIHPDWNARCEPSIDFTSWTPEEAESIFLEKFHKLFN